MHYADPVSLYIITQPNDKARLRPLVRIVVNMESISNWGLRGLLLNLRLLFSLHFRIPTNEGLPQLVIEYLRPHLE